MKTLFNLIFFSSFVLFVGCSEEEGPLSSGDYSSDKSLLTSDGSSGVTTGSDNGSGNQGSGNPSRLVTAAEWNDLYNWDFWNALLSGQEYSNMSDYWRFYTNNRVSVIVRNNENPLVDAKIELIKSDYTIWTSRTDNYGKAELWISLFQKDNSINLNDFSLLVNGQPIPIELTFFENGLNEIIVNTSQEEKADIVEISFIVDATGSMGDELEFLKADLKNVIQNVEIENSDINIFTSTVFYRDKGDDYLVKKSDFTEDINKTIGFITQQSAGGGGDFPEAVHTGLSTCINELQWSTKAKTRIAFLLLDAPPHYTTEVKSEIDNIITVAAKKGIKIIPITASGIDKETEFLMRFLSIATNGTYVFITNDSGIGNDHLVASVGDYQVEYLNDLMKRLIIIYSE